MARTLDDLAELSGVSRATVSRVINGGSVSPATRQRVLDVLETTNYRPNLAARNLASGRSGVVGVVMHVAAPLTFADAYFSQLLTPICDSLTSQAPGMMLWLGNRLVRPGPGDRVPPSASQGRPLHRGPRHPRGLHRRERV